MPAPKGPTCSHITDFLDPERRRGAIRCNAPARAGLPVVHGTVNMCEAHIAAYVGTLAHRYAQLGPDYRAAMVEIMQELLRDPLFGAPPAAVAEYLDKMAERVAPHE